MKKKQTNKRICFVVYNISNQGGAESVAVNLANTFCREYKVSIISLIDDKRKSPYNIDSKIPIIRLIQPKSRLREELPKIALPLIKILRRESTDVVLLIGHYPGTLSSLIRPFVKTKIVFCDHGALINQWNDRNARMMRMIASAFANHTVVLTERTRDDYIQKFHISKKRISCIHNWIDALPSDSREYDKESKRIISVGRLSQEKGFDRLVEIMSKVLKNHLEWHLDIYGEGDLLELLDSLIITKGMADNIHLMGNDPNVRGVYSKYSFYVMASYREGLPLTLLEAKINMLPIIAFDVDTGPREIVRDSIDGYLINPNSDEAFSNAVNEMIENTNKRVFMSSRAKENLTLFTKETIMTQWEDLILSL
jgi:glycosyltransferase involved in cell wall biosynthesis